MDHDTAIRVHAAERYILEEFPPEERTAFEEHFFDCPQCAEEVRAASIFAANATQTLKEERARALERSVGPPRRRFWWTLAASAALNVALLVGIGLESRQVGTAARDMEPQFYPTVAVAPASRGSQSTAAVPKGTPFFGVRFDLMLGQNFESFEYQILDVKGSTRSAKSLSAPAGESAELQLAIPIAGLEPGQYVLVLRGRQSGNTTEIGRRSFSISR